MKGARYLSEKTWVKIRFIPPLFLSEIYFSGVLYFLITRLLSCMVYPISTLPEHLHSTFPSYAKIPENTLTKKKKFLFPL